MPKKKAIDAKGLIKMVEAGEKAGDIMKKMGFKTSTQLKNAYMRALIETGKAVAIKGGRSTSKAQKAKTVGVGKRGSIIISKELIESLGVGSDEKFAVRKTKAGIALKKVTE